MDFIGAFIDPYEHGASVADDKLHFFTCKLLMRRQVTDRNNRIALTLKIFADLGRF